MSNMSKIVVNQDRCKSCQFCINACKKELISTDKNKINILGYHPVIFQDNDECSGCALCAEVCPEVVIEVYKEIKEKEDKIESK